MKRFIVSISLLLVLAFSLGAQAQITIGVVLPTTGAGASLGIPEKNALAFAPQVIGGEKVRYVVYDDTSDSTTALQVVKRLISEDKIDLLLGPGLTTSALAIIDTIAENKIPTFALASATQLVSPVDAKRRWLFKTPANDSVYNATMVQHMVKTGVKTVAVIAWDDAYGEANVGEIQRQADANGLKITTVERFKKTDPSVTGQALRIVQTKPDAVYIIATGTGSAVPQLALNERGYKGKIYHTGAVANADFLRVGGKGVEGALVPTSPIIVAEQLPNSNPTKAVALKFLKAYEAKFGPRSHFAGQMDDALSIVNIAAAKAMKTAKPGTEQFREALRTEIENTKNFIGTSAVYTFSPTAHAGIDVSSMCMVQVEHGTWKLEK